MPASSPVASFTAARDTAASPRLNGAPSPPIRPRSITSPFSGRRNVLDAPECPTTAAMALSISGVLAQASTDIASRRRLRISVSLLEAEATLFAIASVELSMLIDNSLAVVDDDFVTPIFRDAHDSQRKPHCGTARPLARGADRRVAVAAHRRRDRELHRARRVRAGQQASGRGGDRGPLRRQRHTVRRAIAALANRGLVRAERGSGTFIEQQRIPYPIKQRTRFSEIVTGAGHMVGGRLDLQRHRGVQRRARQVLENQGGSAGDPARIAASGRPDSAVRRPPGSTRRGFPAPLRSMPRRPRPRAC